MRLFCLAALCLHPAGLTGRPGQRILGLDEPGLISGGLGSRSREGCSAVSAVAAAITIIELMPCRRRLFRQPFPQVISEHYEEIVFNSPTVALHNILANHVPRRAPPSDIIAYRE